MRRSMVWKLIACFGAVLLLSSSVTGAVFILLFRQNTVDLHRSDLERRAVGIANTLSDLFRRHGEGLSGRYQDYLTYFDELALADVWIVEADKTLITHDGYTYDELPAEAGEIIDCVLEGETTACEEFSQMLRTPVLTVGAPARGADGAVIAAVLLHSPVDGIDQVNSQGLSILAVSIMTALLLAVGLSIGLSYIFTRPLKKMTFAALRLANGDYAARTRVSQRDEIGQLARAIDALAARLRDASQESGHLEQMRRDFIATVSHELRTPVTVMRGSLEALRDGVVTEPGQVAQYHGQMLSESLHMERLINDLLELSRLQNADFNIEMSPVNLCDVLSDVTRGMRRVAQQKGVALTVANPLAEFWFEGDYGRIRQMLLIVLDNAIKFSCAGMTVAIETTQTEGAGIELHIVDEGCGIDPEELPRIFDRFHKAASEANKAGSGLGLAIARQIAQRHGVRITVASVADVKTEFVFYFSGGAKHELDK